ncbi:MAG: BamA/TamA family outer membrane protein [Muribaculaceae bacterium]|nr:BamA/TamA family outer membrane protein [Muribaculaceae bacterium]
MRNGLVNTLWIVLLTIVILPAIISCNMTKHVPDGKMLLDNVKINVDNKQAGVQPNELTNYLRQTENHKVLGGMRLQLAIYSLSGKDSSRWFNRWIQRVGTPPVIYDSTLTVASVSQLHTALKNKGYMNNTVNYTVQADTAKKKARVTYDISLGEPYYIRSLAYNIDNDTIRDIVLADTTSFPIKVGDLLDRNNLDTWRQLLTERLRQHGYYAFNKEYITFTADTAAGSKAVDITLNTMAPYPTERMSYYTSHRPFYVRNVTFVMNYDPVAMQEGYFGTDTISHNDITIMHCGDNYLKPSVLSACNFIEPGKIYNSDDVNRTYKSLSRLNIVKFINIDVRPVGEIEGKIWLDAFVLLQRDKSQAFSVSLEGTNSAGDLGFGLGLDYRHRNLLKGSEQLHAKLRISYESLSGDLSGLINNNYSEYAAEVGVTYPKFKFPFLKQDFKRKVQASTDLATTFNYQARPEYTRIIAGAAWRYLWTEPSKQKRHTFNLIDLNYVYVPKSTSHFLDSIKNPLLRYSFENHFIMRMGYNYYRTNKRSSSVLPTSHQTNVYTIRAAVETAGNLLYGISNMVGQNRAKDGSYKVFGIRYSQYAKAEADYAITHIIDNRQSIAFHVGAGVAVPYGNSTVLPFEKRFYAGGANGVRGWSVRTLGPGSFAASKQQNRFIYQCGDIRFDMNLEYRAKLFWVIELGAFIDAGNIWTIREYDDQEGGVFKFNKFYEQIAMSYGAGLRLDFNYFLLRIDMGAKAFNPASGQERWPLFSPDFKRDFEFHFSVGYPF